jgi:Xaa-Pro aminopeptidase
MFTFNAWRFVLSFPHTQVIAESAREVQRGMTEFQVAGIMAGKCLARGIDLVVALVAAGTNTVMCRYVNVRFHAHDRR